MYNEVDNDLPPFNSIDSEEIFLFSGGKSSSIGTAFLQEDDDEHLRHQPSVVASSSPHLQVDVDELLLSSNYIEPTVCDQHDDSLFWSCKDISEDHLNEILQHAQLNLSGASSNSNNQFSSNQQQLTTIHNSHLVSIPQNDLRQHQPPPELRSQDHQSLHQDHSQNSLQPIHHQQQQLLHQPQHADQDFQSHRHEIQLQPQAQQQQQPIQIQIMPVMSQQPYIEQSVATTQQSFQSQPHAQIHLIPPIIEPMNDKMQNQITSFVPVQQSPQVMTQHVNTNMKPQPNQVVKANTSKSTKLSPIKSKIKDKQTRLDCPYCQRSFCKNFDLQQHMRCHTGEKPFQCIVCGRGFAQKSNVKKHMQAHKVWPESPNHPVSHIHSSVRSRNNSACSSVGTKDEEYMQENESRIIIDSSNGLIKNGVSLGLNTNNKNEVAGDNFYVDSKYSCSYCSFNGRTYFELKSHLTVHKREKVFKCIVNTCGKTFAGNDLQAFLDHVKSHKNELTYHCHLCSGQFSSLIEFGQHQKSHNNTQTKKEPHGALANVNHPNGVNLKLQNEPVFQIQQQQQHQQIHLLQQQHIQIKQEQVDVRQFTDQQIAQQSEPQQQTQLSVTRQPHNDINDNNNNQQPKSGQKYFRCSKCMNRYTTQTALDHHLSISSHHYPCTECDKVFPCERYLRRHLNTHTTVIHVCSYCDKQFKTAAYLKMHSVVHTGEKPFRCNQCDAAFNRRDKLNRHKLTHEPVKKFKCPFKLHIGCTKEFNRPDKLKAHLLTHSGVRPHTCDSCPRTFSRLSRLREHKKLHHSSSISSDNTTANIINNKAVSATEVVCGNNNIETIQTAKN